MTHGAFGCTATAVPSSSTPANSWPIVAGSFHGSILRSDAQMPAEPTRTVTGSVTKSGTVVSTSTTATPSPVLRTARTRRSIPMPVTLRVVPRFSRPEVEDAFAHWYVTGNVNEDW